MQTMMSTPKCVAALVNSIDANSRVIVYWTFAIPTGKFPEGDKFKKWIGKLYSLISSEYGDVGSELVSVWLGVHASDMLQREFNYKRQSAQKAILRCFRFTDRLSKVSEESRHSSRAIKMMDRYWTDLALSIFDMDNFLRRLVDVIGQEIKQTVVPDSKPEYADRIPALSGEGLESINNVRQRTTTLDAIATGIRNRRLTAVEQCELELQQLEEAEIINKTWQFTELAEKLKRSTKTMIETPTWRRWNAKNGS
jgi:hypothetical protein